MHLARAGHQLVNWREKGAAAFLNVAGFADKNPKSRPRLPLPRAGSAAPLARLGAPGRVKGQGHWV